VVSHSLVQCESFPRPPQPLATAPSQACHPDRSRSASDGVVEGPAALSPIPEAARSQERDNDRGIPPFKKQRVGALGFTPTERGGWAAPESIGAAVYLERVDYTGHFVSIA